MTLKIIDNGPVRHILIDRPERRNAVDKHTLHHMADVVEDAGTNPDVRAIVVSGGTGPCFCAGGDLDVEDPLSVENTASTADAAARCVTAITRVPRPVVAAVHGPAVGGWEYRLRSLPISLSSVPTHISRCRSHRSA